MMFRHFLITRFNLKTDRTDWKVTKNGEPVLTEEWLAHRFELFETYCFPSIKNQINQNFVWCIFFDIDTPEKYKERILSLTNEHQNFFPVFVDGDQYFYSTLLSFVREQTSAAHQYVITTRVDNDDCLNIRFIATVQDHFHVKRNGVIDIIDGYQLVMHDETSRQDIFRIRKKYNPFISLIEPADNPETVMSKKHGDWRYSKDIVTIKNDRLWLQLIHDKNLKNALSNRSKPTCKFNRADFGLAEMEILLHSLSGTWAHYFNRQKERLLASKLFKVIQKRP